MSPVDGTRRTCAVKRKLESIQTYCQCMLIDTAVYSDVKFLVMQFVWLN